MLREGQTRIPSGCAISGIFSKQGKAMNGADIVRSMATMHDRSNGLGGGFAGYGIYPQYKDYYAFHVFYEDNEAKKTCEAFLERHFEIINLSKIPVRKTPAITDAPLIWRYFVQPLPTKLADSQLDEKEFVVKCVIRINVTIDGAYVFSSGKNMGVFKAVGFPEDVGAFYRLEEYEGYCWTAHGRYPTNTPGWWGGAHPFALLDLSVVHNGEISSYDANRRYIEMFGYQCTLLTDTEVKMCIRDRTMDLPTPPLPDTTPMTLSTRLAGFKSARNLSLIHISSGNGQDSICGYWYEPEGPVRALLQISHGMCEYIERYEPFIEYMTERGVAVCGNDHLGHGKGARALGQFAEKNGRAYLVRDLYSMTERAKERWAGAPYFLLGHSMGSFCLLYTSRCV